MPKKQEKEDSVHNWNKIYNNKFFIQKLIIQVDFVN